MKISKTCVECGKMFTPKRADANCCSAKCRAKMNYKRKKHKYATDNLLSNSKNIQLTSKSIACNEKKNVPQYEAKVKSLENEMMDLKNNIKAFRLELHKLKENVTAIDNRIMLIKSRSIAKFEQQTKYSDYLLYNTFLNREYRTLQDKGDKHAERKLKSEFDITSPFNGKIRMEIEAYRANLAEKIAQLDIEIEHMLIKREQLLHEISERNSAINELCLQLRNNEMRVLKYEHTLLSK